MDVINRAPTLPYTTGGPYVSRPPLVYKPLRRPATAESDTQTFGSEAATQPPQLRTQQPEASGGLPQRLAIADTPMATAPTSCHTRPSLPSPKQDLTQQQNHQRANYESKGDNSNKERGRNHSIHL